MEGEALKMDMTMGASAPLLGIEKVKDSFPCEVFKAAWAEIDPQFRIR